MHWYDKHEYTQIHPVGKFSWAEDVQADDVVEFFGHPYRVAAHDKAKGRAKLCDLAGEADMGGWRTFGGINSTGSIWRRIGCPTPEECY